MGEFAVTPALPRLVVLAGAHKTASTHLQQTLLAARQGLAVQGVGLIGPREFRAAFRGLLAQPDPGAAAGLLARMCPGARRVVILDENLLGGTARGLLYGPRGAIYPAALRKVNALMALFPDAPLSLGLAIRQQGRHIASCWAEELLHGPWMPFAAYARGLRPGAPQWAALLKRLADATGAVTVWRYEDHAAVMAQVIDWATGIDGLGYGLPRAKRMFRASPSDPAVRALHAAMEADPAQDHKAAYRQAKAAFPRPPHPAFSPWAADETAGFDADYAEDIARIARDPRLTLLAP